MFICGTTRETTPKATSVISSAASTGAPISSAEAKIVENACSAPPTSEVSRGASVSGTSSKVRPRPRSVQASPPMTRKIIVPTSE